MLEKGAELLVLVKYTEENIIHHPFESYHDIEFMLNRRQI